VVGDRAADDAAPDDHGPGVGGKVGHAGNSLLRIPQAPTPLMLHRPIHIRYRYDRNPLYTVDLVLIRPRLTDHHGIDAAQVDLDFAIPLLDEDIPLYVDPLLLWPLSLTARSIPTHRADQRIQPPRCSCRAWKGARGYRDSSRRIGVRGGWIGHLIETEREADRIRQSGRDHRLI
jgi:hypothetical protein